MSNISVKTRIENQLAYLVFQGQGRLNLLEPDLVSEMRQGLKTLEQESEVRVIVLKGEGDNAFSGGVNVKEMKEFSPPHAEDFIRNLHALMRTIMTMKQLVVASIQGPCLGGAMELIMACDLRVSADDAIYGLPEVLVGVPSVIEASLLSRYIGWGKAQEMILTGETIDAPEAKTIGLVNKVVPKPELDKETRNLAARLSRISPVILAAQKDITDKWLNLGHDQGAEYSAKAFAMCFTTSHPREAMEAFLEKREPEFD